MNFRCLWEGEANKDGIKFLSQNFRLMEVKKFLFVNLKGKSTTEKNVPLIAAAAAAEQQTT